MTKINDYEEKKLIIAYYKCEGNRKINNIFNNRSIYKLWITWWNNDFTVGDKIIKMNKGCLENEEYHYLLNCVIRWIFDNYDEKLSRMVNKQKYRKALSQYRKECLKNLIEPLKKSVCLKDYSLEVKEDKTWRLNTYYLIDKDGCLFKGSYDEIKEFIVKIDRLLINMADEIKRSETL